MMAVKFCEFLTYFFLVMWPKMKKVGHWAIVETILRRNNVRTSDSKKIGTHIIAEKDFLSFELWPNFLRICWEWNEFEE